MNRSKVIRVLGIVTLIIVSALVVLFVIFPMVILPPYPAELFRIHNFDNINHTVGVEIFDNDFNLLYNKTFDVSADESITIERGFDWCPRNRFWFYAMEEGSYTFNVSLDNSYNESHFTELMPTISVWIRVFSKESNPLEVVELFRD